MPTKSPTEELLDQIDNIVKGKTFSLEAVSAIEQLRNAAKVANEKVEALGSTLKDLHVERDGLKARLNDFLNQQAAWQKREQDLLAREAKMVELEKSSAVAQARLEGFREIAGLFLANPVRRYTGNESISRSGNDVTGHYHSTTDTQRIDRTEEVR